MRYYYGESVGRLLDGVRFTVQIRIVYTEYSLVIDEHARAYAFALR